MGGAAVVGVVWGRGSGTWPPSGVGAQVWRERSQCRSCGLLCSNLTESGQVWFGVCRREGLGGPDLIQEGVGRAESRGLGDLGLPSAVLGSRKRIRRLGHATFNTLH